MTFMGYYDGKKNKADKEAAKKDDKQNKPSKKATPSQSTTKEKTGTKEKESKQSEKKKNLTAKPDPATQYKDELKRKQQLLADSVTMSAQIIREAQQQLSLTPNPKILRQLREIKDILEEAPLNQKTELRFQKIRQRLTPSVVNHTIRVERWAEDVVCPYCNSTKIQILTDAPTTSDTQYKYLCTDCNSRFNDESGSPLETTSIPLQTWIQCWYLKGCTSSHNYIAAKLGLEVAVVDFMIRQLQRLFEADKPLNNLEKFEDWLSQHADYVAKQIEENILAKKDSLIHGESVRAPTDTAEVRRQTKRRRDPNDGGKFKL